MIKIIIEGPPGSGKTTIMDKISKMLTAENKKHICIKEVKEGLDFLVGDKESIDFIIMTKQKV